MDIKITLKFDEIIINRAKQFAEKQNISLSRLMEFLLDKVTTKDYPTIENLPVSDWVLKVAEGKAEYSTPASRKRKKMKKEFLNSKK